jgi:hypothetical protein
MKTYHTDIRNEYYRDAFIAVDLVEIHLKNDNGVSLAKYFTNGGMNIDAVSSLTGSTVTYTAQGDFLGFTSMSENLETSVGKFSIQLCGIDIDVVKDVVNYDAEGKKVVIKKAFLDSSTLQLIQQPITVYEGYIFNFAVTETSSTVNLNVSCASLFSDFERTAGRKTNNWSNWLLQGVQYDKCMDKAGYVGQSEFLWGRLAK